MAIILRLWSAAQVTEKFFGSRSRQLKKARLFAFAILGCCKKQQKSLDSNKESISN